MRSTPLVTSKTLILILLGAVPCHTLVKGDTLLIDNTDPRVFYSGTWHHIPSSADPQDNSYNGTLAYTTANGAFATITFNGVWPLLLLLATTHEIKGPTASYPRHGVWHASQHHRAPDEDAVQPRSAVARILRAARQHHPSSIPRQVLDVANHGSLSARAPGGK